jgi:hypothetical protein
MRRLPGPAGDRLGDGGNSRGSLRIVSGLAENTNSIICDGSSEPEAANGCPVLLDAGTISREAHVRSANALIRRKRALQSANGTRAFLLTKTYMDAGESGRADYRSRSLSIKPLSRLMSTLPVR